MFGRPIVLDVLGIAPIDRLGELRWLGPMSVVVFGLIVGLVAHAFSVERFDRWMLLLRARHVHRRVPADVLRAGVHPARRRRCSSSGGVVLLVIAVRTVTVMGVRLALVGVVVPAGGDHGADAAGGRAAAAAGDPADGAGAGVFTRGDDARAAAARPA